MNTNLNSFQIVRSRYATEALTVARKSGMTMKVVGQGDVPLEPFYKDEWWFEPVTSESTIPPEGLRRLDALLKGGVPIKGLVIAHEAPRLLTAPLKAPETDLEGRRKAKTGEASQIDWRTVLGVLGAVLTSIFLVFGFIFMIAIRLDPALIAVLPDGSYLEVMTWYE